MLKPWKSRHLQNRIGFKIKRRQEHSPRCFTWTCKEQSAVRQTAKSFLNQSEKGSSASTDGSAANLARANVYIPSNEFSQNLNNLLSKKEALHTQLIYKKKAHGSHEEWADVRHFTHFKNQSLKLKKILQVCWYLSTSYLLSVLTSLSLLPPPAALSVLAFSETKSKKEHCKKNVGCKRILQKILLYHFRVTFLGGVRPIHLAVLFHPNGGDYWLVAIFESDNSIL